MFSLVYVSSAIRPFSADELTELLAVSRANNATLGVTGMLLYKSGNFMQVLEGEEGAVQALRAKIVRDPRHQGILILLQQEQSARAFPHWSMGFRDLNSPEVRAMGGYSEFLNVDLKDQRFFQQPSVTQKLLLMFRDSMT